MAKAKFNLPRRLKTVTGKLEVFGQNRGEFCIRCHKTGHIYLLSDGDTIKAGGWSATVKMSYLGNDKLNGDIGRLISLPGKDQWGYARHLFFWRLPVEPEEFQPWLDAYVAEDLLTVTFAAQPLADTRADGETFICGRLEPFHEQGMEGNIGWSVFDTQKHSYAALHMLEAGDKLTIFNATGKRIVWQGTLTKRRLQNLQRSCYDRKTPLSKETKFLIQSFFKMLPAVVEKKKAPKAK